MAVMIESNEATPQELHDALVAMGVTPETPAPETQADPSSSGPAATEPVPPAGEQATTEAAGKTTEPVTEPEGTTQEGAGAKSRRGGAREKIDLLTRQLEDTRAQLESERGDKRSLSARLEKLETQLVQETEKAAESAPAGDDKKLVRPKRPTLKEFEFDQEKYEAAMDRYDTEMDSYNTELRQREVREQLEAADNQRQQDAQQREYIQRENGFVERRDKNIRDSGIENFQELMAAAAASGIPSIVDSNVHGDLATIAQGYIKYTSESPAALMVYLAEDILDNSGKESERLGKITDGPRLIAELARIEDRLVAQHAKAKEPPAPAEPPKPAAQAAAAAATPPVPPAQPKPAMKAPEPPIETLGGRTGPADGDLAEQLRLAADRGDFREVRRIRDIQRVQDAKRHGRL